MADRYTRGVNRFYGNDTIIFAPGVATTSDFPLQGTQLFHNCTVSMSPTSGKNVKPHVIIRDSSGSLVLDIGARASTLYKKTLPLVGQTISQLEWVEYNSLYSDKPTLQLSIQTRPTSSIEKIYDRIFLDTETTGLDPNHDEILQLAIIDGDGNVLLNQKYKPDFISTWREAEQIHHISPKDVAACPLIADDLPRIQAILDSAERVYAFNAPFDFAFLGEAGLHLESKRGFDTMRLYARKFHGRDYIKLTQAARESHYSYHPHDALADCLATLRVQNRVDGNVRSHALSRTISSMQSVVDSMTRYNEEHSLTPTQVKSDTKPEPSRNPTQVITSQKHDIQGENIMATENNQPISQTQQDKTSAETTKKPIWKKWWFWVLIVFAFFIIVGSISGSSETKMPNVVGKSLEDARTILNDNGFTNITADDLNGLYAT